MEASGYELSIPLNQVISIVATNGNAVVVYQWRGRENRAVGKLIASFEGNSRRGVFTFDGSTLGRLTYNGPTIPHTDTSAASSPNALERVLKMPVFTLTLLYKESDSYKWEGCKRIQLVIQPT